MLSIIKDKSKIYKMKKGDRLYININGTKKYQTQSSICPKIVGTSIIVKVLKTPKGIKIVKLKNTELAKLQGYDIPKRFNQKEYKYMNRVIGNSIPGPVLTKQIKRIKRELGLYRISIGAIGTYGLENYELVKHDFKFGVLPSHINNNYLNQDKIIDTMNRNFPQNNKLYNPTNYHNEKVNLLIYKSDCRYGSTINRNRSSDFQENYRINFIEEVNDIYDNYISKYEPDRLFIELPVNFNHNSLSKLNKDKKNIFQSVFKKYRLKYNYLDTTLNYKLTQNRKFYIMDFELRE